MWCFLMATAQCLEIWSQAGHAGCSRKICRQSPCPVGDGGWGTWLPPPPCHQLASPPATSPLPPCHQPPSPSTSDISTSQIRRPLEMVYLPLMLAASQRINIKSSVYPVLPALPLPETPPHPRNPPHPPTPPPQPPRPPPPPPTWRIRL